MKRRAATITVLALVLGGLGCGDDDVRPDAARLDAGEREDAGIPAGDGGGLPDTGPAPDAGPTPTPDDLAGLLEPIRDEGGLPALAAAVFEGDRLIAIGATGVRAVGDPTPVTIHDQWHLGSCTKAMTATLLGVWVETGLLDWDTSLAEAFPSIALDPGLDGVTLAQLLAHRGGMDPEHSWLAPYWGDGRALDVQRAEVADTLLSAPPVVPVGDFSYANSGYIVVGAALEAATGRTWEDQMQTEIFNQLGMTSCGFGAPGTPGTVDQPHGHTSPPLTAIDPGDPGSDNPAVLGPAGTVHCSLADWGKFVAIHVAGERGEDTPILPASAFERLHQPWPGGDYALGWGVTDRTWAGGLTLVHSGSNTLWLVITWVAPLRNRFMLLATNVAEGADAVVDMAAVELVERYFP